MIKLDATITVAKARSARDRRNRTKALYSKPRVDVEHTHHRENEMSKSMPVTTRASTEELTRTSHGCDQSNWNMLKRNEMKAKAPKVTAKTAAAISNRNEVQRVGYIAIQGQRRSQPPAQH